MMTKMAQSNGVLQGLAALVEDNAVPQQLVKAEMQAQVNEIHRRLERVQGTIGTYLEMTGESEDQFYGRLYLLSMREVKVDLALRTIADQEAFDASPEEVTAEIEKVASQAGLAKDHVEADLVRSGRMPALRSQIRKDKAFRWLMEHVELVDEEGEIVERINDEEAVHSLASDAGGED
jgi:trigger factor